MARKILRVVGWLVALGGAVLVIAGVLVFIVLQTQPGHDFVLRTVLAQAPDHVNGEVRIGGLRSDGLLRGFTLHDVSIRDDRGRPFLDADSVRVRYSIRQILDRNLVLSPADLWGARVVLETLHGDESPNVVRIFEPREPRDPPAEDPPPFTLALERLAIHDSELVIRLPLDDDDPPARGLVDTVEGIEGLHQRIELSAIQARIRRAAVLRPGQEGERFHVERLTMVGRVFEDPFVLDDFRGVVERVGARVSLEFDRLWLPETELAGRATLDWSDAEAGLDLDLNAEAAVLDLADLRWIEPSLPEGTGRLNLAVQGPVDQSQWRITDLELDTNGSRLQGDVGFDLGPVVRLVATDIQALPLHLSALEPWLQEPLPMGGRLRGRVRADGPLGNLRVNADVTYDDPELEIPASGIRLAGGISLTPELEARALSVEADPLQYGTLRAFLPDLEMSGQGRLDVELTGNPQAGMRLAGSLTHTTEAGEHASRVVASGTIRQVGERWLLGLDGNLDPLDLDGMAIALGRELPVAGTLSGPVRTRGSLDDLALDVNLMTAAGRLEMQGRFDVLEPGARYRAEGRVQDFDLHRLVVGAPDPSVVTGRFEVDGRGATLETLDGTGRIEVTSLDIFGAQVDRITAAMEAREGRLFLERFEIRSPLGRMDGRGDLGLRSGSQEGEIFVSWDVPEVAALRPVLLGDTLIAGDTLTDLERLNLQMQGIDPDTLPDAMAVALEGSAHGELVLRGVVQDLAGEGFARLEEAVYGDLRLREADVDFQGRWAGRDAWSVQGSVDAMEFRAGGFALERIGGDVEYRPNEGSVQLEVRKDELQEYRLGALFAADTAGVDVEMQTLVLELEEVAWTLEAPARIRLTRRMGQVDEIVLTRPAEEDDPGRLTESRMAARGTLSFEGDSDFQVVAEGVDIARIASMLQMEEFPRGILDLTMHVRGPHEAPVMDGRFSVLGLEWDGTALSRVEGTLDYENRIARAELLADLDGRRVLTADGRVPVDLSFRAVEDRFHNRDLDLTLRVDGFPIASVVAFLEALEGVEGTLDGQMTVRGTPQEIRPSGQLTLQGGATSLPELGLRLSQVGGTVTLREDRIVEVDVDVRARGSARVEGTVSLEDVADPGFDLRISASNFQAVDRRDLNARVGGEVTLTGSFTRPRVGGRVRVEQGTLFVEEFARTAEVVDLTDPAFFDVVDTTLVAARPALEAAQNPFIQNLRVDVDLVLQRDFWLRSREMNMEIGGELGVIFDRPRREILLVGSLDVTRGIYSAFGRQFQVRGGTVEFMGTPGIDPALDVEAVNRLRREGGEPLNIIANVEGTLTGPQVSLSSDSQPPIAQSDLISYLIFGRPSGALASGETSVLEGAAGAGVSAGVGAVATQLGAVVARQFGVDYLTVTQSREAGGVRSAAGLGTFADTQIELGQYVGENLFLALMVRPLTGLGARTQTQFPGARLEWRFADLWSAEGFVEDRFAREAASGFGELGLRLDKVFGLSIYREWSY